MNVTWSRWEWDTDAVWSIGLVAVCLLAVGIAAACLLVREFRRRSTTGGGLPVIASRISAGLSLLGVLALALAAIDLRRQKQTEFAAPHVVLLLDESESVRRDREKRYRELERFSRRITPALGSDQSVQIVRFSGTAVSQGKVAASALAARLSADRQAVGGTNLEAAMNSAQRALRRTRKAGVVVLCSDGRQTTGDALAAAQRLGERGVPIHVFPLTSSGPPLFLHGASAPATVRENDEAIVRALIRNSSSRDYKASLEIARRHNAVDANDKPPRFSPPQANPTAWRFPQKQSRGLLHPLTFTGRGLQFIELKLTPQEGAGAHRVSLPVYVRGRPRLLAIGYDTRWTEMIDPEKWKISTALPPHAHSALTRPAADFDAIALSAVDSQRLESKTLPELRRQVEKLGSGLLLLNGDHANASEETPSVLMSYLKTELEEILPVAPGPRTHIDKPPPRRVVIVLDRSGSMGSANRLPLALHICRQIIAKLRPIDSLEIVTYNHQAYKTFAEKKMTPQHRAAALASLQTIFASGGTNANTTLQIVQNLQMQSGAFVMLSDGDFSTNQQFARDLRARIGRSVITTAYGMGMREVQRNSPLYAFDYRRAVNNTAAASNIKFQAVEPEERKKAFEREPFLPGIRNFDWRGHLLPDRNLPGHAVSTLSPRAGVQLVGVHPENSDPILTFGDAERGRVGVFSCGIPSDWRRDEEARRAVTAWCNEVSAFHAIDRYWISAARDNGRLRIRMVAVREDGSPASLSRAAITLRRDGRTLAAFSLQPDGKGVLQGAAKWSEAFPSESLKQPHRVLHMTIKEFGKDALARTQRLPVAEPMREAPSSATSAEDWTQGVDRELLAKIAEIGGGRMLDELDEQEAWPDFSAKTQQRTQTQYWRILAAISAAALTLAMVSSSANKKW